MNTRRQFVVEGIRQAALVFVMVGLVAFILGAFQLSTGRRVDTEIGILANTLTGPGWCLLLHLDISNQAILFFSLASVIPFWIGIGALAGLAARKMPNPEASPTRPRYFMRFSIAVVALALGAFSQDATPAFTGSGPSIRYTIINNVRQLDGARSEFIEDKHPPANYIVTEADLVPYIYPPGRGKIPRVGPERYVLNPLDQPVYAILDKDWRIPRRGWQEGHTFTNGTVFSLP